MTRTVWIRNADWVVVWDPSAGRHAYLKNGDVAFAGNALTFVGRGYGGAADEIIDGRGLMVMPGLIDVHSHPNLEASYRGIREEHGIPEMYMSGLFERSVAYWPDAEACLPAPRPRTASSCSPASRRWLTSPASIPAGWT